MRPHVLNDEDCYVLRCPARASSRRKAPGFARPPQHDSSTHSAEMSREGVELLRE